MSLYTRTGDQGITGLLGGQRVPKAHLRVNAYGEVDELNSVLGWARLAIGEGEVGDLLLHLQTTLFELGADLATPAPLSVGGDQEVGRIRAERVRWLEETIDRFEAQLPLLRHFVLPGGTEGAARLHLARTVCRRAERSVVSLAATEPVNPEVMRYLNRLSDLLFVLARVVNQRAGVGDTPWAGPASRTER